MFEFKFREITDNEVFKYISQFPDKSNSDIVGLDALLKQAASLFNASVKLEFVLTDWKNARVCLVFKGKGSKTDISNYRPISVSRSKNHSDSYIYIYYTLVSL